ncbi:hypothetical protein F4801DRAFT_594026 [Xylaria longipes]|nr:hypothetical protein F4801DRAFT_594026 [Xylaria longipes]
MAGSLRSPDGSDDLGFKLFSIRQHLRRGVVRLDQLRPLVRHVVDKSPDAIIWDAVFSLMNDWLHSLEEHFLADAPYKLHTTKTANQFKERKGQMNIFLQKPDIEGSSTLYWFKADLLRLTRHIQAYSSGPFNIHDEPDKFARAFIRYTTMDNDAIGLNTFIKQENSHRYITLGNANSKKTKVSDKLKLKVEQLKLGKGRGIKRVAKVVAHRQITTIAEMREGLVFPKPHKFRDDAVHLYDPLSATANANTSGNKRKSSFDNWSDNVFGFKRRQLNNQKSKLAKEINNQLSIGKDKPSPYTPGEDLWENRIYSCLVVSPAGRVISDFRTTMELLESIRDAIKAHQSLYMTGNILQGDISPNNIIITEPETADGFKGMLIDLDMAKVRDSGPSGARHQIGTMQFMAVEVLRAADHTYRHDLQSFFYVLLWMCARQSWSNGFGGGKYRPEESLLREWEIGTFKDIARGKSGDMNEDGLEAITDEFPEALDVVKPLCLRIRSIMFGDTARLSFGTPTGDPDQLYRPVIAAYDKTINNL